MVLAKPFLVYKIELLFKPDEAIGHLMFYWQPRMFVEVTFYESFEAWLLFDPNFFWHPYMSWISNVLQYDVLTLWVASNYRDN